MAEFLFQVIKCIFQIYQNCHCQTVPLKADVFYIGALINMDQFHRGRKYQNLRP